MKKPADPKLYNPAELAVVLGVKPWFIRRMKFLGFKMPLGRATVAMAHTFLEDQAEQFTGTSQAPKRRRPSTSGK